MTELLKHYLDLLHDAVCRLARRGDETGHGDGERQNDRLGNRNVVHWHGHGDEDGDGHGDECALRQVLLLYRHTNIQSQKNALLSSWGNSGNVVFEMSNLFGCLQ